MKYFYLFILLFFSVKISAQNLFYPKAKVDYDAFENLVQKVKPHREQRLVTVNEFIKISEEPGVIILDTRSKKMFDQKHIKGALHLNFSDFTQENLAKIIPSSETTILIYCNNNFEGDEVNFASKMAMPEIIKKDIDPITLALNIPTYLNLYGYGYSNVYELSELVYPHDKRIEFEGSEVR